MYSECEISDFLPQVGRGAGLGSIYCKMRYGCIGERERREYEAIDLVVVFCSTIVPDLGDLELRIDIHLTESHDSIRA